MLKHIAILTTLGFLAACAYTFDREYQAVTLRTTGAKDAVCDVWAAKIRYKYYPPQTRNLKNAPEDLVIKCYAPGNRSREVVIQPRIEDSTYGNVVNGLVPGVIVDYTSGSMFGYPDSIDIDFTHIPYSTMPQPAHNNTDIMNSDKYYLEEYRPGEPRMNNDRFEKDYPLQRRSRAGSGNSDYYDSSLNQNDNVSSAEKGELNRVLGDLAGEPDYTDTSESPAVDVPPLFPQEPLPLFPVE